MKDIDVLVELYKEQRQLGLHHEGQRNAVTGIILTIASGLIVVIGFDKELTTLDLPVAFVVVLAGVFGAILSLKHYERFRFHRHRSRVLRKAIDAAFEIFGTAGRKRSRPS
jgi:TctA family transporter